MRIAILTNDFPPHLKGGAGRIASLQADWFKARGYDVRVYHERRGKRESLTAFAREKGINRRRSIGDVSTLSFSLFSLPSSLFSHIRDLFPDHQTVQDIVAWKPDVLISHNLTGCGWGTARDVRRRIPCRWLHLLHDVQLFEPSGQICAGESFARLRKIWRRIWAFLRKRFFGIPDAVISPSQWLLDQHRRFGFFKQTPTHVIPNPANIVQRRDVSDGASPIGQRRDVSDGASPIIIYIGRLSRDKGVGVLLEAWKQRQSMQGSLVLIGDGPLRKDCEAMADRNVATLGALPNAEALEYLKQASLLVLPSLVMENQPTVLLEAIASGVPAVATDVGGVRELLGGYGKVIPPGDPNALSRALFHPPIADAELGRRILLRHGIDTVMKKWVELF